MRMSGVKRCLSIKCFAIPDRGTASANVLRLVYLRNSKEASRPDVRQPGEEQGGGQRGPWRVGTTERTSAFAGPMEGSERTAVI